MNLITTLNNLGISGVTDQEDASRIRLCNKISYVTAFLMILISPILFFRLSLFIPLLMDFTLKLSVLFFNRAGRHGMARGALYGTQVVAIAWFGCVLAGILQLEYAVVLLIAVNYYIFKEKWTRRVGLVLAIAVLLLIEYAHYLSPFKPQFGLNYKTAFLLNLSVVLALMVITILVIISYADSNDLRFKLEKANKFIKLFVNTVTHELRSPIGVIHQTNYFLRKEIKKESPIKSIDPLVNIIENASAQALHIINNVLSVAKIEAGRLEEASPDVIPVKDYFAGLVQLHGVNAQWNGMELNWEIRNMPDTIVADQFDLTLIVSNLLSNAIKYGKKGGKISLDISKADEGHWQMVVTNPGKGIRPERIGRIFEPFVSNRSGAIEGTGLGLYIVKTKLEAMKGRITVVSEPDVQTQFTVTLPLVNS